MKCQNCGENEANIKYTQMINDEKSEMYLCEKCAQDMKIDMNFDMNFGFDNIFSSLFAGDMTVKPVELSDELYCDVCGTKYADFAKTGLLGCENCYRVFSKRLDSIIKRLHGNNRHVEPEINSIPKFRKKKTEKSSVKNEIEQLKEKLEKCIKSEEYEEAAIIRDKIKVLEKKMNERERGE